MLIKISLSLDAGCGNGNFLKLLESKVKNVPYADKFKFIGIDFNEKNIKPYLDNYQKACIFSQEDMQDINTFLNKTESESIKIVVFSGTLTEHVIKNAF
ncbi:methyltransferase domain-containing protein [Candidatus Coxiella mudrowiae]|uniref:methyltransferase domain-containing protein n=1 Tax=Candidatus Coxiella mudrowiae TaxID=2054173 RepID=UPI0009E550EB